MKLTSAISILVLLTACEAKLPTMASDVPNHQRQNTKFFRIYGNSADVQVTPEHASFADKAWMETARCAGIDPRIVSGFSLRLWDGLVPCNGEAAGGCYYSRVRIDVPADFVGFDQGWRHEFLHLALDKRDGDSDDDHSEPEWQTCQYYWLVK